MKIESVTTTYIKQTHLALLLSLVILSILPFWNRVSDCLFHPELQNTTDMDIFAGAGKHFLVTQQLYQRSDNYQETYAPGTGVYKFPPAYQLTIIPLLKLGIDDFTFLFVERVIQLLLYLSASFLLIITIGKQFIWLDKPITDPGHRFKASQFILISLLITLWSMGFFESFSGIEPEIFVFFLLSLAFYFSIKHPILSGAILACAAAIKIYPAFMLLFFIFNKNTKAFIGFLAGLTSITLLSIYLIGIDEHIFYIENILPILLIEKPIKHIQNTTVESLFYVENIIHNMDGIITLITKAITISIIFIVGLFVDKKSACRSLLFFGMLTSAVLLWLSNYWQQYQVTLGIPILCLLAYSIQQKSTPIFIVIVITSIALCIQEAWFQELKVRILSEETGVVEKINAFAKKNPSFENSDPLLYFFPFLWILLRLRNLMFLAPLVLFFISAWVLINDKNTYKNK